MTARTRKSPDEIRNLLKGPVTSIPTPFLSNGDIDWDGVDNIIEIGIGGGSGVILLTAGDSQYFCLSEDEIAQLTQFTIERTAGPRPHHRRDRGMAHPASRSVRPQVCRMGRRCTDVRHHIPRLRPRRRGCSQCRNRQNHPGDARRLSLAPRTGYAPGRTRHLLFQRRRRHGLCRRNPAKIRPPLENHDRRHPVASPSRMALWLHHLHGLVHLIRPPHRLGIPPGSMPQRHSRSTANHSRNRTPALGSAAQFPRRLANHVARHPGTLRRLRPISQIAPTLGHRKRHGISPCVSGPDWPC